METLDDTFDAPSNGLITQPCAGCGVDIPRGRKWCSEACRNRHRDRSARDDQPAAPAVSPEAAFTQVNTGEGVWSFASVVRELVDCGLVVDLEVEGIQLRLSAGS